MQYIRLNSESNKCMKAFQYFRLLNLNVNHEKCSKMCHLCGWILIIYIYCYPNTESFDKFSLKAKNKLKYMSIAKNYFYSKLKSYVAIKGKHSNEVNFQKCFRYCNDCKWRKLQNFMLWNSSCFMMLPTWNTFKKFVVGFCSTSSPQAFRNT